MIVFIKKSLLAGLLIGLGGFAFLSVNELYVGAFVFSVGLISVILLRCNLYTGKVGYARSFGEVPGLLGMCLLNMAGAFAAGLSTRPLVSKTAEELAANKLNRPMIQAFVSAAVCGALIYLAVELYKRTQNILTIIIPVFVFVASKADHCIANAYYFAAALEFSPKGIGYLAVCAAGNAAGSLIISLLKTE